MQDIVSTINSYIWSDALIYLALGAGLFFSILTRFVQVRMGAKYTQRINDYIIDSIREVYNSLA